MYNEYIYSPLRREEKFYRENSEKLNGKYPYDKAEALLKEIKKRGVFENG